MEFRKLTAGDLEASWQCRLRGLRDAPKAFGSTYEESKRRGPTRFTRILANDSVDEVLFGAVKGERVVGLICVNRQDGETVLHKAAITSMFVDLECQRQGIGGALLDLAIAHAQQKMAVKAVYLAVESNNLGARTLYESRQFKVWGREPLALRHGETYYSEDHMVLEF